MNTTVEEVLAELRAVTDRAIGDAQTPGQVDWSALPSPVEAHVAAAHFRVLLRHLALTAKVFAEDTELVELSPFGSPLPLKSICQLLDQAVTLARGVDAYLAPVENPGD